jgi:hypothetical protein
MVIAVKSFTNVVAAEETLAAAQTICPRKGGKS